MSKREPNTDTVKKLYQLIQLLRGTEFRTYAYLMEMLNTTQRSIQRYFDDLNKTEDLLGGRKKISTKEKLFVEERTVTNANGKAIKEFRIFDPSISTLPSFSEDEINIVLSSLIDLKSLKVDAQIKNKLIKLVSLRNYPLKYETIISTFRNAITMKQKVFIKEYYSRDLKFEPNSSITPVYLDIDDKKVYAYILGLKNLRAYKFESMYGVKSTKQKAADYSNWNSSNENRDVFGFTSTGKKIKVHIEFDSFVRSQLIRQFPRLDNYVKAVGGSRNNFSLRITVFDIAPIGRFIFGVISKINISGDDSFKKELKKYYEEYIKEGLKSFI
ncbi:MAG: hypothetical protein NT153_05265 [Bacteroidetes bacterium]|nr:hypothetical protein [Bacteroidota bacterium]